MAKLNQTAPLHMQHHTSENQTIDLFILQKILLCAICSPEYDDLSPKRPRLLKHVHKITNLPLLFIGMAQYKAAVD